KRLVFMISSFRCVTRRPKHCACQKHPDASHPPSATLTLDADADHPLGPSQPVRGTHNERENYRWLSMPVLPRHPGSPARAPRCSPAVVTAKILVSKGYRRQTTRASAHRLVGISQGARSAAKNRPTRTQPEARSGGLGMTGASRALGAPRVVNIEDLRSLARSRLPKVVFDYLDGGAEGETTLEENRRAFHGVTFRPRQAVAISSCDLRTRVLGIDLSVPVLLAP